MKKIESIYGADYLDSADFERLLVIELEKQRGSCSQD
jgi:hypothetical protein